MNKNIIFLTLLFGCSSIERININESSKTIQNQYYVNTTSGLNLHYSPNVNSKISQKIDSGSIIKVLENTGTFETIDGISGEWVKIAYFKAIFFAFKPHLTLTNNLVENVLSLDSKSIYSFIHNNLESNNYEILEKWIKYKNSQISVEKLMQYEDNILLTISPTLNSCGFNNISNCMNFLISNNKIEFSDLKIGHSLGSPTRLTSQYASLIIAGVEGDECGYSGGSITFKLNLNKFDIIAQHLNQSNVCKNECPCSEKNSVETITYEYENITKLKIYSENEMKKIFHTDL